MKLRNRSSGAIPQAIVLLLIVVLLACKDDSIRKAARASDDMATVISLAIDVKRGLGQTGTKVISNQEELALTLGLQKVNTAVKAFHLQVKNTKALDPASKNKLLQLFSGVTTAVGELNQQGVLGIHNEEARAKVAAVLAGFQTAFATIQAALGGA
jgi:hypothetical protein